MKKLLTSLFLAFTLISAPTIMATQQPTLQNQNQPKPTTTGSYYAVIAACSRYENTTHNIPKPIHYTDKELSRTYNMLLQTKNWQEDHIILLLNDKATKTNITNALRTMAATLGPNDTFLFQWCGHGTAVTDINGDEAQYNANDTQDEAICPYDCEKYSNDSYENLIIDDELGNLFSNITCKGMVLLFDCCLSGSLIDNQTTNITKPWTVTGPSSLDVNGPNRVVIMATPQDCLELGTYHGFPLNCALAQAGTLDILLHHHGATISAEQLYRHTLPFYTIQKIMLWTGLYFYSLLIEHLTHPRMGPIRLIISNTIGFFEAMYLIHHAPIDGHLTKDQMTISDNYPGELPLLIT